MSTFRKGWRTDLHVRTAEGLEDSLSTQGLDRHVTERNFEERTNSTCHLLELKAN